MAFLFPPSFSLRFGLLALILASLPACNKKAQIQYSIDQARQEMTEVQAKSKKLEMEIYATGNLGRYQTTHISHVAELKRHIGHLKSEADLLRNEQEKMKERAQNMQRQLDTYRAQTR